MKPLALNLRAFGCSGDPGLSVSSGTLRLLPPPFLCTCKFNQPWIKKCSKKICTCTQHVQTIFLSQTIQLNHHVHNIYTVVGATKLSREDLKYTGVYPHIPFHVHVYLPLYVLDLSIRGLGHGCSFRTTPLWILRDDQT